jgi:hypothetical protein
VIERYSLGDRLLFRTARLTGLRIDTIYRFWPPRYFMMVWRSVASIVSARSS